MRILGIDPSLRNLGYCFSTVVGDKLIIEECGTFQPDKFLKSTGFVDLGNPVINRQLAVEHYLSIALTSFVPDAIGCESAFYNGCNPKTIMNQARGLGLIEQLCSSHLYKNHSPHELCIYTPNVIKASLGLKSDEFKDKLAINKYILKAIDDEKLVYLHDKHLPDNQLDHANDAVAIAYTVYLGVLRLR